METIYLRTEDEALRGEVRSLLPEGVRIADGPLPEKDGVIFFDIDTIRPGEIRELSEAHLVIAVTGRQQTGPVMEAAASGAYETVHRPLEARALEAVLDEVVRLRKELKQTVAVAALKTVPTCAIVGHSAVIMDVCKKLARLAQVEAPVLVTGETGTGKELIAESIAQLSSRFGRPFVVVNCAAVPEALLESELFGFEKGSFTGAVAAKEGLLKIADSGTVFFDEIGELPLALQGKLLRFLQTQAFYPIGSTREVQVDVRFISATNRDLLAMVRDGLFREDLYHRLRVTSIHIPPLRERKEDILPLIRFFLGRYHQTAPRRILGITTAFLRKMTDYDWPGNIRELENTVRTAIALSKTHYLTTHELRELEQAPSQPAGIPFHEQLAAAIVPRLRQAIDRGEDHIAEKVRDEVDRILIDYALNTSRENQSEAARILGISRLTLRKKIGRR